MNNALYYPYIDLRENDIQQIKAMSLFYDKIYRIVPEDVKTNDCKELQDLIFDNEIIKSLDPIKYAKDASKKFLSVMKQWDASGLQSSNEENINITKLHTQKIDSIVRDLFNKLGYREHQNWIDVPTDLASNYMLFLAKEIAIKNKLQLVAKEWAPWTATTYFNLNGSFGDFPLQYENNGTNGPSAYALFSLIINKIVPLNIAEIPIDKILLFREKRISEIDSLRESILKLYEELQNIEEPFIREEIVKRKIDNYKKAIEEYKKSADIIKVKGWFGTLFFGFTAPISLGYYFNIPFASSVILGLTELAIAGIINISTTKHDLKKLRKESSISCLIEMKHDFKNNPSWIGEGSINNHAFNCLEKYIND